jgi:hypothetical protein
MSSLTQILEGPRLEAGLNIKLDTSLENDLEMEKDDSTLSSCSQISEPEDCHKGSCCFNKFVSQGNYYTCFHCGAFVSKTGAKTFKSSKMNYVPFFSSKTIYETMTRRSAQFRQSSNPEYSQIRQAYVEWVLELADKLRISSNSTHLAILLLDTVMYKDSSLTSKLQLYAPVCLLIAAKTIELDERIPFIPKLRRYANPTFSIDDYRKAELHTLDIVDWNPQFSSALEINEFLMCQGVLFSTDEVEENAVSLERGKLSPEGLRENTQRDNIYHLERALSPSLKGNQENSFSDASTNGTNIDSVLTPYRTENMISQQVGDVSPSHYSLSLLQKQHSTSANFETCKSESKVLVAVQDKIEEILTHFETNYIKLSTYLLRDIDFIEWEPKVVSAAMMAFFRSVNRVTPIWNEDLETITQLNFVQISQCYDLMYRKYKNAFSISNHKVLSVIPSSENQKEVSSDLKLVKSNSNFSEKSSLQPKTELANRINLITNDPKLLERKPMANFQSKANVSVANSAISASYGQPRDDLRLKTRYGNGTINTELPPRNSAKNQAILPSSFGLDSTYATSGVYPSIAYLNTKANISFENELPSQQSRLSVLNK